LVKRVNNFSNPRITFPKAFYPQYVPVFQNEKTTKELSKDASKENVEIITVTQNCVMIFETNPVLIAIGKNTTTITR
jgi:hypothetical protein